MSPLRETLIVAGWEFRRYFKWKDQLIGVIFFLVLSGAVVLAGRIVSGGNDPIPVAVDGVPVPDSMVGRLRFVPVPPDPAGREAALREGDVRGILSRGSDGGFTLLVARHPAYQGDLEDMLTDLVRVERLQAMGLAPGALDTLLAPAPLQVRYLDSDRAARGGGEKVAAGVSIAIMLLAVFSGMAYLFTGITGEKQLRVTESVLSAIAPQSWIDGKILGITAFALTGVANLAIGGALLAAGAWLATGFTIPAGAARPEVTLALVVFTLLGLFLWNGFFAAIAATIDDPNTSTRSSLMMTPLLPVLLALAVLRDPDSLVSRVLAVFPLTSVPAMPVRIVLSDPSAMEVALAVVLLVATIGVVRRLAGRVFEVGVLMYGKEPSFREMARWAVNRGA